MLRLLKSLTGDIGVGMLGLLKSLTVDIGVGMLGLLKSLTGDIGLGMVIIDVGIIEESNCWYWARYLWSLKFKILTLNSVFLKELVCICVREMDVWLLNNLKCWYRTGSGEFKTLALDIGAIFGKCIYILYVCDGGFFLLISQLIISIFEKKSYLIF